MTHELDDELDKLMGDAFAAARPGPGLEDRVIVGLRERWGTGRRFRLPHAGDVHPLVRRAAVGVAAAILLGGVGLAVTSTSFVRVNRYASKPSGTSPQLDLLIDGVASVHKDAQVESSRELARREVERLRSGSGTAANPQLPGLTSRGLEGPKQVGKLNESEIRLGDRFYTTNGAAAGGEPGLQQLRRGTEAKQQSGGQVSAPTSGEKPSEPDFDKDTPNFSLDANGVNNFRYGIVSGGAPRPLNPAPRDNLDREKSGPAGIAPPTNQFDSNLLPTDDRSAAAVEGRGYAWNDTDGAAFKPSEFAGKGLTTLGDGVEQLVRSGRDGRETPLAIAGTQLGTALDETRDKSKETSGGQRAQQGGQGQQGQQQQQGTTDLRRSPSNVVGWDVKNVGGDDHLAAADPKSNAANAPAGGSTDAPGQLPPVSAAKPGPTSAGRTTVAFADPSSEKGPLAVAAAQAGGARVAAATEQTPPATATQSQQSARKVIRNGEMTFDVDGFDSAVLQISKIAAEEGGFVATTESEKLPNGKVKGTVVVRCPPERLDTLVLKLRGLGDLRTSRVVAQDVTKQYTDLDAQLRAAKTMEQRLLELIKGGKGEVKDLIEAEKQLGSWREKIERLEGEVRYYDNLVSLSTLTVTLAERDIRNAALLTESEVVNMGVEADDVEAARAAALKAIEEAKGRVVESDLKRHDAGQFAATITADVAPDKAGAVIDRLKQLGRVARLEVQRRQATAEGASSTPAPGARLERKDTRLAISIYNLANVAARRTTSLQLAADDVETSYRAILAQVESAGGRVLKSQLTRPAPDQTAGEVVFEAPSAAADVLLDAVRTAGEVMRLDTSTNPDTQDVTDAKRGFSVSVRPVTGVPARERVTMQLAVDDVPTKYEKLLDALRNAGARVVASQVNQQDPNNASASLEVDARRANRPAVERALAEAGGVYGRTVTRAPEHEITLEDKVRLSVTMGDVDVLPPREQTTIGVEAADVAKAAGDVEATALALGGRKVDSDWAQQPGGQTVARVVVDVPLAKAPELLAKARDQGRVLTVQRDQSPGAPEGPFARARLTMTVSTADPIVSRDQGFAASIRSGLSTSVQWLLRSVTLIVIGLCLVGPWALIAYAAWRLAKRRKDRRPIVTPPPPPSSSPTVPA